MTPRISKAVVVAIVVWMVVLVLATFGWHQRTQHFVEIVTPIIAFDEHEPGVADRDSEVLARVATNASAIHRNIAETSALIYASLFSLIFTLIVTVVALGAWLSILLWRADPNQALERPR